MVPNVARKPSEAKVAKVVVDKSHRTVRALDGEGKLISFYPASVGSEERPARNADGIVVLTGGSSRVTDAMELLAAGYGKRLLISGVHPTNDVHDLARTLPDNHKLLSCCVDLDRSAVNTRSNAAETRRWASPFDFARQALLYLPKGLPADIGQFDYIILSAVYEHLLPSERPALLTLLWSHLRPGGVIFLAQTPYRWFPVELHTTGLPLINYLPDRLALACARRFSKRVPGTTEDRTCLCL